MNQFEQKTDRIRRFLEFLDDRINNKNDRGLAADLRHGFSEGTAYRSWPHIGPWCRDLADERERIIMQTVAAGFAVHGKSAMKGNMGAVLRQIALGAGVGTDGLKSFEGRFRRFLTFMTAVEVCGHLPGVLRVAERKGIGVNFEQLYKDLIYWDWDPAKVKVQWASQYWILPDERQKEV